MFGFVTAAPEKLTEENRAHYKAVYCGLCEDLGEDRRALSRMALTYDLVFLAIVLSSFYNEKYEESSGRCPVHPLKKRSFCRNRFTRYASDMNIALAYYKYMDDVNDDSSFTASLKMKLLGKEAEKISRKYPRQCADIRRYLNDLEEAEKNNILIPDIPAEIFGSLLGSIFKFEENEGGEKLFAFGKELGKFIYILDAAVDMKKDIKKQKYNPLIRINTSDHEVILQMIMAECVEKYNELNIEQDKEIIENILFSGVWTAFDAMKERKKK